MKVFNCELRKAKSYQVVFTLSCYLFESETHNMDENSAKKLSESNTTTTTTDPYTLIVGRLLTTFLCLLLLSLCPQLFECVSPLAVSVSLVNMLSLVSLSGFFSIMSVQNNHG